MPKNNRWAMIAAIGVAILVAAAQAFLRFLESGDPFPATTEGWVRLLAPSILAGFLSATTPYWSKTEAATGYRTVSPPPGGSDAPVVVKPPSP